MRLTVLLFFASLCACSDVPATGPDAYAECSRALPAPSNVAPADRIIRATKPAGERTVLVPLDAQDIGRRMRVYDTLGYGDWVSGSLAFVGPEPAQELIYGSPGQICALDFAALEWPVPEGAAGVLLDLNPSEAAIEVTIIITDA